MKYARDNITLSSAQTWRSAMDPSSFNTTLSRNTRVLECKKRMRWHPKLAVRTYHAWGQLGGRAAPVSTNQNLEWFATMHVSFNWNTHEFYKTWDMLSQYDTWFSLLTHACIRVRTHACTGIVAHAFTRLLVHASITPTVHAWTSNLIHACIKHLVHAYIGNTIHACARIMVHGFTRILMHACSRKLITCIYWNVKAQVSSPMGHWFWGRRPTVTARGRERATPQCRSNKIIIL